MIDATNNRITSLPASITQLTGLQRLVREESQARVSLSRFIASRGLRSTRIELRFSRLQVLAQNKLTELPPALCKLAALKILVLDSNKLEARIVPSIANYLHRSGGRGVFCTGAHNLPRALGASVARKAAPRLTLSTRSIPSHSEAPG